MKFYNTLTRQKEEFKPADPSKVGLYCCGPTVYNYAHIGNLRTYIFEDFLRRSLEFNGYVVNHVMNITDVGHLTSDEDEGEDKMEKTRRNMLFGHCKNGHDTPAYISCERGSPFITLELRNNKFQCKVCGTFNVFNKKRDINNDKPHPVPDCDVFYKEKAITAWDIAEKYTQAFLEDMDRLNMLKPTTKPKATDHIEEMINQIKQLKKNGLTYKGKSGNIYYDTSKFEHYGELAQLDKQNAETCPRVETDKNKKHPSDFILWFVESKFGDQDMQWDSPWGKGFPGWHIECSAMSSKYLGEQFDIHCGGIDHIPVHHTNEIAQAEGATGVHPWVKYWMHGEFLVLDPLMNIQLKNNTHICPHCDYKNLMKSKRDYLIKKEVDGNLLMVKCQNIKCNQLFSGMIKMAKSSENFLTLTKLIEKNYNPLDYRYLCLNGHYRKELIFNWESMDAAKTGRRRLHEKVLSLGTTEGEIHQSRIDGFADAISDDLNMPQALALAYELMDDVSINDADKLSTIKKMDSVLGLKLDEEVKVELPPEILQLILDRNKARDEKDWAKADKIRDKIQENGKWIVKDGEGGTEVISK